MDPTRRDLLAGLAALAAADPNPRPSSRLGMVIHSFPVRSGQSRQRGEQPPFGDPFRYLEYCRTLGAAGVQMPLGRLEPDGAARLKAAAEAAGMYLEGSILLPRDAADLERFTAEVRTAAAAGANVLRTVCLVGRRYETFTSAEAFRTFAERAWQSLKLAEPVAAKHGVRLAVENHKDWRVPELVDLLKRLSSPHVGVCLDTGNSIALLEDPTAVVAALAPFTFTTHLKDMAVKEYADGFLLSEVPLGTGFLDVPAMVATIRKHRPDVRLNLEMITRDPLPVPCLTPGYWATLGEVKGAELADALARVRKHGARELPKISPLPPAEQLAAEDANVRKCLEYAARQAGW